MILNLLLIVIGGFAGGVAGTMFWNWLSKRKKTNEVVENLNKLHSKVWSVDSTVSSIDSVQGDIDNTLDSLHEEVITIRELLESIEKKMNDVNIVTFPPIDIDPGVGVPIQPYYGTGEPLVPGPVTCDVKVTGDASNVEQ